jgi:hypothetical protein
LGSNEAERAPREVRESLEIAGRTIDPVVRKPIGGNWTAWILRVAGDHRQLDATLAAAAVGPTVEAALVSLTIKILVATGDAVSNGTPLNRGVSVPNRPADHDPAGVAGPAMQPFRRYRAFPARCVDQADEVGGAPEA